MPPTVTGGSQTSRLTVTLAANAPPEGATIMLESSNPNIASIPRTVRIHLSTQNSVSVDVITTPVSTVTPK